MCSYVPEAPETKEFVIESLKTKCKGLKAKIKRLVVGFEIGEENEKPHFHVVVIFDRLVKVYDARFWDIGNLHGHYQTLKKEGLNERRASEYARKGRDFIDEYDLEVTENEPGKLKATNAGTIITYVVDKVEEKMKKKDLVTKEEVEKAIELVVSKFGAETKGLYLSDKKKILEGVKIGLKILRTLMKRRRLWSLMIFLLVSLLMQKRFIY